MGDVLPFGRGMGDDSISGVGQIENTDEVHPAEPVDSVEPEQAGAPAPPDPRVIYKEIDNTIQVLRKIAQQAILLPPGEDKKDLLTKFASLEATALELQGRLVPASGDPENEAVAEDLQHLQLDTKNLVEVVEKNTRAAGGTTLAPTAPITSKTAMYIGMGIAALLVAGGLFWAYSRLKDE